MINHPVLYSLILSVFVSIIFFIVLKDKNKDDPNRYDIIKNDILILFIFTFFVILMSNILYSNFSKSKSIVHVETNKCPF